MSATLTATKTLDASFSLDFQNAPTANPSVRLGVIIDDGAGGPPTDSPLGDWMLLCSYDGVTYFEVYHAHQHLVLLSAGTSTVMRRMVNWIVVIPAVPGRFLRLSYARVSGGASSRAQIVAQTLQSEW